MTALIIIGSIVVAVIIFYIKRAMYRGVDEIENKIRASKESKTGSQKQDLASIYGQNEASGQNSNQEKK